MRSYTVIHGEPCPPLVGGVSLTVRPVWSLGSFWLDILLKISYPHGESWTFQTKSHNSRATVFHTLTQEIIEGQSRSWNFFSMEIMKFLFNVDHGISFQCRSWNFFSMEIMEFSVIFPVFFLKIFDCYGTGPVVNRS